ncbi:MAG: geranylgeranyl reductase family protein [Vulcanisaeta sp.]
MNSVYDVIVVGAGPAGSMAAYVAAKLGLKVLVIDRFRFPRVKPCGGGLTQKSVTLLRAMGIDPEPTIRGSCNNVIITNYAGSFLLTDKEPIISVVSRDEFDNYLLTNALNEGVDYLVDRVIKVNVSNDRAIVTGLNDVYVGNYVIAADGANSVIARQIGNDIRKDTAIAFMSIARGDFLNDLCIIDMTRIRWGYSWVFPRSNNEYDVGIGSIYWGNYRTQLTRYINELGMREGVILGHPIPIKPRDTLTSKRVVLVGDAGGFADPTTGEGIFYAMYTGVLAALASRRSINPVEFVPKYLGLIKPLIKNLSLAYYLSLSVYGIDNLIMGRAGLSAFSNTGSLIKNVMSGRTWYQQAIKSIIKYSLIKGPQTILKKALR